MPSLIFKKGLDLKHEVAGQLAANYHSELVARIKGEGYRYQSGRLTVHLAKEFGFCYGVDRAVDYAYQASLKFPNRRVFLTGEIIHNPHVNEQLRARGIRFLSDAGESWDALTGDDVVILPAFGVTVEDLVKLDARGCTLVDTTCGSVLNVWKNVRRYAHDGFTSIIHGKHWHEETRATASQAIQTPGGHYLVVLDHHEAAMVCEFITSAPPPGSPARDALLARFREASSPGFDPDVHLTHIGCANQTTMLSTESFAIGEQFRAAIRTRYGAEREAAHFRAFDTICSATQDRQDAVIEMMAAETLDLMIVVGGYNSSNTCNLARICAARVPTFHIADPDGLLGADAIRHRDVTTKTERVSHGWLPSGPIKVGLTSGASTPDNLVETVVLRLTEFTGATA